MSEFCEQIEKDEQIFDIAFFEVILNEHVPNGLDAFHRIFADFHGFAGIVVSIVGVIIRILTLSNLCRKKFRTPTNLLLSSMTVTDMLTMLFYIPLLLPHYSLDVAQLDTEPDWIWNAYYLISIMLSATCHTYSLFVSVALAIIGIFQVRKSAKYPADQNKWRKTAKVNIGVAAFIAAVSMSPYYYKICQQALSEVDSPESKDFADKSSIVPVLLYAVLSQIIPSNLMVISGSYIIIKTTSGKARRRTVNNGRGQQNRLSINKILLIIIGLFVITELSQGCLMILGICIFLTYIIFQATSKIFIYSY